VPNEHTAGSLTRRPVLFSRLIGAYIASIVIQEEVLPNVKPGMYAMICLAASLLVFVYENLGAYGGW